MSCVFNYTWLTLPQFKDWLEEKSKSEAWCRWCQKKISLSNMGVSALNKHIHGKKHKSIMEARTSSSIMRNCIVTNNAAQVSSSTTTASTSSSASSSKAQYNLAQHVIQKDSVTTAEVQWCLFAVTHGLSNRCSAAAVDLFKIMFPNYDTVIGMSLGRDKVAYTLVYGIAPYVLNELKAIIAKSPVYMVSFDESLNKISQRGQMDVHVRFWMKDKVVTRFYSSEFLGHATAINLVEAFNSATKDLDEAKILQVGLDGPNVNLAALRRIKEERPGDCAKLIDIGSCSLHVVHGSLKTADKKTFQCMEFLKNIYWVFKDLPSRRADYHRLCNDPNAKFPLKYCVTRWVENGNVAKRALEILPHLQAYVEGMKNGKSEPDSKSYLVMKKMLLDPLLKAKLTFFISIISELEPFLIIFQTDSPMLPFLHERLEVLTSSLLKRVVKASEFQKLESGLQMAKLTLSEAVLLDAKDIVIGYGAKAALHEMKKSGNIDILGFKNQCRTFLVHVIKKLQERSPLKNSFVYGCASLDPDIMNVDPSECHGKRSLILDKALVHLVEASWLSGNEADKVKMQYENLCSRPSIKERLASFDRKNDRLDVFLISVLDKCESDSELHKFVRIILCLSHGQAAVERGFSLNKNLLVENQKEESLIAQRLIQDFMLSRESGDDLASKYKVDKALMLSARNAASRYKAAKQLATEQMIAKQKQDAERKRKARELLEKETEEKRLRTELQKVQKDIFSLKKN